MAALYSRHYAVRGSTRSNAQRPSARPHGPVMLLPGHSRGRRAASSSGDSEVDIPISMTNDEALSVLQIKPGSTPGFEQIMAAKNKLVAANDGNHEKCLQVEAAYDTLFMQSMKRRISGELEVSTSVRYADVPNPKKRGSGGQRSGSGQATILQNLPGGGISVEAPRQNVALVQAAVMGSLLAWSLAGALVESADAQAADTAGLQLALAAGFAVYSYKETKKLSIGRSVGLMAGTCFTGILVGALLNQWLRVDIVPIGSFGSPGVFVTEFAIASLWAGCAFLA